MISYPVADLPALPPHRALRRGGPHLFRAIWPELRASLAEACGSAPGGPPDELAPGAEPSRPPWSRAA